MKGTRFSSIVRAMLCFAGLIFSASVAAAQVASGTITGVVSDPSGAVVPAANVIITHVEQGVDYTVNTSNEGVYIRRFLPVGTYTVTVETPGFKKEMKTGLVLTLGQTMSVDLHLMVGAESQTVEVRANVTQLLKPGSSEVGQIINHQQVQDLPLLDRNIAALIPLNAGVLSGMQGESNSGYNYNGSRSDVNMYTLDGVDNINAYSNMQLNPSVDAVEQIQVQTATYSAEFGLSAGGIVQVQLRSGSNRFHGSAWDFLRNDIMDANGYFANQLPLLPGQTEAPKQPLKQNQYGFAVGGPVKKDKIFFFGDWQGTKKRVGGVEGYSVPTAAEIRGDFSQIMSAGTVIYQNQYTGTLFPGSGCNLSSFSSACQQVPSVDQNSIAQKVLALYPLPNQTGTFTANYGPVNNWMGSGVTQLNANSFDIRTDFIASQKDSLSFHYSYADGASLVPAAWAGGKTGPCIECGNSYGLDAGTSTGRAQNIGLNYIRSLSPAVVNSLILGVSRGLSLTQTADGGQDLATQFGMPNVNIDKWTDGLPWFYFYPEPTWAGTSIYEPAAIYNTVFQISDTLSWVRGKHMIKAGAELRLNRTTTVGSAYSRGYFVLSDFYTGNAVSDFLSGDYTELFQQLQIGTRGYRSKQMGMFFQDDIKVTPKLTLNLGVRLDLYPGVTEAYNRLSNLNMNTGQVLLAGLNGAPRSFNKSFYNDWAPRIGFAYSPSSSGKWVFRGGYGISYWDPNGDGAYGASNPPYMSSFSMVNMNTNTYQPLYTLSDGIPQVLQPSVASFNRANPTGSWIVIDPKAPVSYTQSYSFGIERALGWKTVLDVSYVGTKGTHLNGYTIGDPTPPGPISTFYQRAIDYNIIPNVTGVSYFSNGFTSNYNSLQVKLQKTISQGLQYLTTYTWGKSMDDMSGDAGTGGGASNSSGEPMDPFNWRLDYARSSFDITDKFTSMINYNLPLGRGAHFGSGWNPVVNGFLGGWQTNAIVQVNTGLPFSVFPTSTFNCGCSYGQMRASLVPGAVNNGNLPKSQRTVNHWFNSEAFMDPPSSTASAGGGGYGTAARNSIFGPAYADVDFSLFKKFTIREKAIVQLRLETFNLFNKVNFFYPISATNATWNTGGLITQSYPGRIVQVAVKIGF